MARCRCAGSCSCTVTGGPGITVSGSGNPGDPYVISGGDTDASDFQLRAEKGVTNGYAGLDAAAKVPFSQTHITVAPESSPPVSPAVGDVWIVTP